ncbi:MAG: PAS domain S-box protein [Nitrospirae bacterium]|nr:PAS domain S-box protein [Nitrospirota bacterium]
MISEDLEEKIKTIKNKVSFVDNLRKMLKDRVESNITSLFETNVVLQQRVYQKTNDLDMANKKLREEIANRQMAEDALLLSENRYKRLVGAITDYIYTVEVKSGRAVSTKHSPGCVAVTGYTSEEYASDIYLWYRMIHEADRETVMGLAGRVLAGEAVPSIEHRLIHKDGSIRWVRNTIVPRHDVSGSLIAYDGLISDITERKLAEEALRHSENRYRHLLGAMTDYIYTFDVKSGTVMSTSHGPGCVAVTGYTTEDYNADKFLWYRMIHSDDRQAVTALTNKVLTGEPVNSIEHRIIHKDGSLRWIRNTPVPRHDGEGKLIGCDGLITDITGRKLAEEELRKSKEQLQDFFDNASDMIHIVGPDGRFRYVNRAWRETLGYSQREVAELSIDAVIHPNHRESAIEIFNGILTGSAASKIETVFVTRHGKPIVVLGSVNCSFEDGSPSATRGIFHDITEIRKAEEALKKYNDELEIRVKERTAQLFDAKTYLESVLSSLTDALIVVNSVYAIQTANHSACALLGYTEDTLVGMDVENIFEESIAEVIYGAQRQGIAKDIFMTMKTKEGVNIPVLVNMSRLGKKSKETIIVAHDMREIKKFEEEAQKIQLKMLTSSKMATLGEIATGIAHEINQPLTYISSFIQGLILDIKRGSAIEPEELKKEASVSYKQVGRIVDIIQHLRTFGRRDDIEMEYLGMETVLHNALLLMGARIRLHNINLVLKIERALPTVIGSANQLEQVFINLMQNTMDAFARDEKNAEICVEMSCSEDKKFIVIRFSDNGMGIAGENLEKIFEPFFTTKEVGKGTGLGLSIVYGIISEHNGTITCESKANKGTTFTIKIPVGENKDID